MQVICRFVSGIVLSMVLIVIASTVSLFAFMLLVALFTEFSFPVLAISGLAYSIGGSVLAFILPLLFMGLHWAGGGSKWISAVPIVLFIWYTISDFFYFFSDGDGLGPNSVIVLSALRDKADVFYYPGAVVLILAKSSCYFFASLAMLSKDD